MIEFEEIKEKKINHMDIPRLLSEKIIKENIRRNRQKPKKELVKGQTDGFLKALGGLKDED